MFRKLIDRVMGTSAAPRGQPVPLVYNRAARRAQAARMQRANAEPRRRKFEKRGMPGRASKGRRPHRAKR